MPEGEPMQPSTAARVATSILFVWLGAGCGEEPGPAGEAEGGHVAPTARTVEANAAVADELPLEEQADFVAARRGFIAERSDPVIRAADGHEVWNTDAFEFVEGDAPPSVNPSLWRQAKLNGMHGLYQVTDGIYQVRGYDLSNITFVKGDRGWIVIDPGTTIETGRAALELANENLGERPVTGLVYTHSHIDHFGGARGVLPEPGDTPVIAPQGFVVEAVSENVLAGTAMSRRASYMFGFLLHRGARGHVDSGLGKASTPGTFSLIAPTRIVDHTPTEITVDGVQMVFSNTPGAEAPAEMMIWLPQHEAICGAEIVTHNLHNLYTLRGAKVRDALLWSGYIQDTLDRYGDQAQVLFASHHWPTWGNATIRDYLKKQRDAYKYIHDQTLRLANEGYTMVEIAERIQLPESLRQTFSVRGYYGTVDHDSKAVYQHYFGYFDGVPAHLHPLPPAEAAVHCVEFMGGADALLEKARASYDQGEYRWVAEVVNQLVFADPDDDEARALLADAYDQLGYQAESGPWRDFYLTGAKELREGLRPLPFKTTGSSDIVSAIPTGLFFDGLAARLNGPKAEGKQITIDFVFTDVGETHVVWLENAVLHHRQSEADPDADATLTLTRATWDRIVTKQTTLPKQLLAGTIDVDGSRVALLRFFSLMDDFDPDFPIVTP
jgi:alkyl sulfatase BDS1-like metallo-beta-lactamase superfamily hydrolase